MRRVTLICGLLLVFQVGIAAGATEETKQTAIDNGLAWLAANQVDLGAEGYWVYPGDATGNLATTASAALAFIEEGYLPGDASIYDAVVTKAVAYIFNRATIDNRFGVELDGYPRYAEDYNNDGIYNDGNNQVIYFEPGASGRRVYTTGLCAPVVYALGNTLGIGTVINVGSPAINGKTYAQAMQDIVDWFSWAQVEPSTGFRGGWRYDANWSSADNSTAQWGSLPLLYAADWSLGVPQFVFNELTLWINYIQDPATGGSGYDYPWNIISISKTGGLLLELAAIGAPVGDLRVQKALAYINTNWNTGASGTWNGNFDHPYAMWALYKGLQVYGFLVPFNCGPGGTIQVGQGIPAAPGGKTICFDSAPSVSVAGDWYSHYCDHLCNTQLGDGSWAGYSYWTGALAAGWYINILNATEIHVGPYEVSLDIKPTSCPNPFNMKIFEETADVFDDSMDPKARKLNGEKPPKGGVLPVAILGKDDFDVHTIDLSTVMLNGVAPLRNDYEDVATPYMNGMECGCTTAGPDGYMDLTLKFQKYDIAQTLLGSMNGEYVELTITGLLTDGREFEGTDCVIIRAREEAMQPGPIGSNVVLNPAVPNPFNPMTRISYYLPNESYVEVSVYDVAGRLVDRLVASTESAGDHFVEWDASGLASGTYFCKLTAGSAVETRKLLLVK